MLDIFKKDKPEKVSLNLQNPTNQRVAIKASLDNKITLTYKGHGVYFMDLKRVKDDKILNFFKQLSTESVSRIEGAIYREDPKCDYLVIYDHI